MHQITSIEPKWLSEVAPTFFRVADLNKISKRKAAEKIEPLHDRFAADKDDWVSISVIPSAPNADSPTASQQGQKARLQLSSIHQWRWRPWLVACTFYQSERLSLVPILHVSILGPCIQAPVSLTYALSSCYSNSQSLRHRT